MKVASWGRVTTAVRFAQGLLLSLLKSRPGTAPPSLLLVGGIMSILPWGACGPSLLEGRRGDAGESGAQVWDYLTQALGGSSGAPVLLRQNPPSLGAR